MYNDRYVLQIGLFSTVPIFLNWNLLHSTDKIKSLFLNIELSPAGRVERVAEEPVYLMFIDLLHDIEGMAKQYFHVLTVYKTKIFV